MKRVWKVLGYSLAVLAALGVLLIAIFGDVQWLQYMIAAGIFLWAVGEAIDRWQNRAEARHQQIVERLAEIARLLRQRQ